MAKMTPGQYATWLKQQPAAVQGAVVRGVRSAAHRGVGFLVEEIDKALPHPAVDTGGLRQSARAGNTPTGAFVEVDAPNAGPINYGTRPFFPPLAPLVAWAVRKFGVSEQEAKRIAFNVAKKISEEGIEPRHFFEKAMARIEAIIDSEVAHELERLK